MNIFRPNESSHLSAKIDHDPFIVSQFTESIDRQKEQPTVATISKCGLVNISRAAVIAETTIKPTVLGLFSDLANLRLASLVKSLFTIGFDLFDHNFYMRQLGFKPFSPSSRPKEEREQFVRSVEVTNQEGLAWQDKLRIGVINLAFKSTLALDHNPDSKEKYQAICKELKNGDVLFFSYDGAKQSITGEFFDQLGRWSSFLKTGDEKFPFQHVGVYESTRGGGVVHHLTFKGAKTHSIEKILSDKKGLDGIAIGRFNLSPEQQSQFVDRGKTHLREKSSYNFKFIAAAVLAKLFGNNLNRSSGTTKESMTCVNVVTESYKDLFGGCGPNAKSCAAQASVPRELFAADQLKIVAACEFEAAGRPLKGASLAT